MAPKLLYDVQGIDPEHLEFTRDEIQQINPQRFEFAQLDGVVLYRPEERVVVGVRNLRADEFWVRGHMPGRPLFPGVLMVEAAAQLCSFYSLKRFGKDILFGFGGADRVRFRKTMTVGDQMLLVARPDAMSPRRSSFQTQGILDGAVAFEANILGVALPSAR